MLGLWLILSTLAGVAAGETTATRGAPFVVQTLVSLIAASTAMVVGLVTTHLDHKHKLEAALAAAAAKDAEAAQWKQSATWEREQRWHVEQELEDERARHRRARADRR